MQTFTHVLVTVLLLTSLDCRAQQVYPAAVSTSGILFGKHETTKDATNALPDTIALADAKSIFAINAICVNKQKELQRTEISGFQMTVVEQGKSLTIKGNSSMLSKEMKDHLNTIQPGARLIFEGIEAKFPNGESRYLILLDFTVK